MPKATPVQPRRGRKPDGKSRLQLTCKPERPIVERLALHTLTHGGTIVSHVEAALDKHCDPLPSA